MDAEALWLPALLVIVAAPCLVALVKFALRRDRRCNWCRVKLRCPLSGEMERCVVRIDARSGRFTGIEHCTAFRDSDHVGCNRPCAKLLNLRRGG